MTGPAAIRVVEGPDVEACAKCGATMEVGDRVVDTDAVESLPYATSDWATVHASCYGAK